MSRTRKEYRGGRSPQPEDAYERFAPIYDLLGFSRFTPLAVRTCTEFLAESELAVTNLMDLACGTGHFAIAMAKKGIPITGIDGSKAMLVQAKKNAGRMANAPKWIHGEFVNFQAAGRFDLITCWFDSLNHLVTDAELTKCFRRVHRHLAPGGAFIFDVNTPIGLRERWSMSNYQSSESHAMIKRAFAEPSGEFAWLELEAFVKRGKNYERIKIPFFQRGLNARTVRSCLRAAHFDNIHVAPFEGHGTTGNASKLFISAWR